MRRTERVLYGRIVMYRERCPECKRRSLLLGGQTLCCDVPVQPGSETRDKRESGGESGRRRGIRKHVRDKILKDQGGRCIYCGIGFSPGQCQWNALKKKYVSSDLEFDHFLAWSYSGNTHEANLVAACRICNAIKHSRLFNTLDEAKQYVRDKREEKGYQPFYVIP